jgi:hypothetical protein
VQLERRCPCDDSYGDLQTVDISCRSAERAVDITKDDRDDGGNDSDHEGTHAPGLSEFAMPTDSFSSLKYSNPVGDKKVNLSKVSLSVNIVL